MVISVSRQRAHRLAIALCALTATTSQFSFSLPQGGNVITGSADIHQNATNELTITQHADITTIDFNEYSIDENEIVRYIQPSETAIVVNQVTGTKASEILGQLQANGQIFLINPNGVLFGENAQVDVASLIVSTGEISAQKDDEVELSNISSATIQNFGNIQTFNGDVTLLAEIIENHGNITVQNGDINLLAGKQFLVRFGDYNEYHILASTDTINAIIKNRGELKSNSGNIRLETALENQILNTTIHNQGLIEAQKIEERGGRIFLNSVNGDIVNEGTITSTQAFSDSTGDISLEGIRILQQGTISTDNLDYGDAGDIAIYADDVVVLAEHSQTTSNAHINGNGGNITNLAQNAMRFEGSASISATGGEQQGNGGTVEVSGLNYVSVAGSIDVKATEGKNGTIIIDPIDLTIGNAGSNTFNDTGGNNFEFDTTTGSTIDSTSITTFLNNGNVLITTDQAGPDEGSITVDEAIDLNGGTGNTLTLRANQNIQINANICDEIVLGNCDGSSDQVNLRFETLAGTLDIASGVKIDSNGGDVTFNISNAVNIQIGADIESHDGFGNAGTINITNSGPLTVASGASIDADDGNILIIANGNAQLSGLNSTSTAARAIDIISSGAVTGGGSASTDLNASNGGIRISANNGISDMEISAASLEITNDLSGSVSLNIVNQADTILSDINVLNDLNITSENGNISINENAITAANDLFLTATNGLIEIPDAGLSVPGNIHLIAQDVNTVNSRNLVIAANDFVLSTTGNNEATSIQASVNRLEVLSSGRGGFDISSNQDLAIDDIYNNNDDGRSIYVSHGDLSIQVNNGNLNINDIISVRDQENDEVREGLIDIAVNEGNLRIGDQDWTRIESLNEIDQDIDGGLGTEPTSQVSIRIRQTSTSDTPSIFEFGDNNLQDVWFWARGGDILVDAVNGVNTSEGVNRELILNSDVVFSANDATADPNDGLIILNENITDGGALFSSHTNRALQLNSTPVVEPTPEPPPVAPEPEIPTDPEAPPSIPTISSMSELTLATTTALQQNNTVDPATTTNLQPLNDLSFVLSDFFGECSRTSEKENTCYQQKLLSDFLGSLLISSELPEEKDN